MRIVTKGLVLASGLSALGLYACKHVNSSSRTKSEMATSQPKVEAEGNATHFDLNDVSILINTPTKGTEDFYLRLSTETAEGPLLSQDKFEKVAAMLKTTKLSDYKDWALIGLRIDDCAKLLAALPCQAQIRLTFQPIIQVPRGGPPLPALRDAAMHLAFDLDEKDKIGMFQDFLDLKKSALPVSTEGLLGPHPVLKKEGLNGPFARRLYSLIKKYALPSRYERIAAMGVGRKTWEFVATQPIKNGVILPTPIPCQSPKETTNTFINIGTDVFGLGGGSLKEKFVGCADLDLGEFAMGNESVEEASPKTLDAAIKTNNPSQVFFASTSCVNCHVASRRLDRGDPNGLSTADDANPMRYKKPDGISHGMDPETANDTRNVWGFRAFGWSEQGGGEMPSITAYTLNDTMRAASGLNELIKKGELK